MPTLTVTNTRTVATGRSRSLSLVAPRPAAILSIPNELIIDILELAITHDKASASRLAVVCKTISEFIDIILYRTVLLHSLNTISLFNRTVHTKSLDFLQSHVKQISITCEPSTYKPNTASQLSHIIRACAPYALVAPSQYEPLYLCPKPYTSSQSSLAHIVIESFIVDLAAGEGNLAAPILPAASDSLSHLRVCEPSDGWASPLSILASFGSLPHLTHLHLARRADSNTDNDVIFVDELRAILRSRPALRMLVVSVFSPEWLDATSARESSLWGALQEARGLDGRLVVRLGTYGEWRREWKGEAVAMRPTGPADFWKKCALEAVASADAVMQHD
ncbi:hypothetical protein HGRIS_002070 [Hohenbuehelia grisea]|uniref:F-box domain-containing protein n=1 Tax=Hohenbuehelia grisea TaxID=104357 RepID=A0ABR3JL51_9AGAR